jgi:hypothetical protein
MDSKSEKTLTLVSEKLNKHAAAVEYAKDGFRVLPCWPRSKKPLTPNGFSDASTDLSKIDYWWSRCPDANIAIQTRDLLVLDIDCKNGVNGYMAVENLERKYGKLPATKSQLTPSGGKHLIFKTRDIIVPSLINCPAQGLDIRAHSGYILAEPSTINGMTYSMDKKPIADAPVWLLNLVYGYLTVNDDGSYHSEAEVTNYHAN